MNEVLFARLKSVRNSVDQSAFSAEEKMLLEKKYRGFMMGGAELNEDDRKRFREISEELSKLTLKFEENVLEETNSFELHLEDPEETSPV